MTSSSFILLNDIQSQLTHTLIGGGTWVYSFQLNKAINEVIDGRESPWTHFISAFIIMLMTATFIVAQKGEAVRHWSFRSHVHEVIMGANIFKTQD